MTVASRQEVMVNSPSKFLIFLFGTRVQLSISEDIDFLRRTCWMGFYEVFYL
jgi:hypothetical protein